MGPKQPSGKVAAYAAVALKELIVSKWNESVKVNGHTIEHDLSKGLSGGGWVAKDQDMVVERRKLSIK